MLLGHLQERQTPGRTAAWCHRSFTVAAAAALAGSDADGSLVKIGFVGAGGVCFGTNAGPWNHSARLAKQPNVQFTAIVDPDVQLAQRRVDDLSKGAHGRKWEGCRVYRNYRAMLADKPLPDAVIIGVPPSVRGSLDVPQLAVERDLANAGLHMLVEKPISMRPTEEVERLAQELDRIGEEKSIVIAVGYMLRYSSAIEVARELLQQVGRAPTAIVGRYSSTYDTIASPQWWDTLKSGGCIVGQATHFVDAMRHLARSEIERGSIRVVSVGPGMPLLNVAPPPAAEHTVPVGQRPNRAMLAIFKFESGVVGSLSQTMLLHGSSYFTELDVFGDGFHIIVRDPYAHPAVLFRRPHSDCHEEVPLDAGKDIYEKQFEAFLRAVRTGDKSEVRCMYADAARTYEASWWIIEASGSPSPDGSVPDG